MTAPSTVGNHPGAAPAARTADAARLAAERLRAGFEHALSRRDEAPPAPAPIAWPPAWPATLPWQGGMPVDGLARPAPAPPVDVQTTLRDAAAAAAAAPGTPGRWRIELPPASLPVQALDVQRDAGGRWQVLLQAPAVADALLQRLRERLVAFGATLRVDRRHHDKDR